MKRLVAFDLDGTLTQHRTALGEKNRAVLDALGERYRLVMVGAGSCERIFSQMGGYPIDIIGNYGLVETRYDSESGACVTVRSERFDCDRESVSMRVRVLRERHGFTDFVGESVQFHGSGAVTFPILGTGAAIEDKLAFDPSREKRRAIFREVCEAFPEYTVFVGGSSSFDMVPKPYDKYYALSRYCEERGYSHGEVVFVGDDYGVGGNDESVYLSDIDFIKVDDHERLGEAVAGLLKEKIYDCK